MTTTIDFFKGICTKALKVFFTKQFNIHKLNSCNTLEKRIKYARRQLPLVGDGTTRTVFRLTSNNLPLALKIAKNDDGIYQNKREAQAGWNEYATVAKVYAHAKDYSWITMELCQKVNSASIKDIYGVKDLEVEESHFTIAAINHMVARWGGFNPDESFDYLEKYRRATNAPSTNPPFERFMAAMDDFIDKASPDISTILDLKNSKNWGIATRNGEKHLVILDYGFDDETQKRSLPPDFFPYKENIKSYRKDILFTNLKHCHPLTSEWRSSPVHK